MIDKNKNQSVEIEFWDIEPEEVLELEESDIPGVYFNEFREYVDEEGNELLSSIEMTGSLDDNYETEGKEILNYELVGIPLNSKGIYQKEDITVIYVYKKVSAVFEEQIPPTGENFKLSYPVFILISLVIFILKKRICKKY